MSSLLKTNSPSIFPLKDGALAHHAGSAAYYKITSNAPASDMYYLIGTLPAISPSTGDLLRLECLIKAPSYYSVGFTASLGQRNAFFGVTESLTQTGLLALTSAAQARIEVYQQASGISEVYAVFASSANMSLTVSALMSGFAGSGELIDPAAVVASTVVPSGALLYSSATDYLNAQFKCLKGVVSGSAGIGYLAGQGGSVVQAISKSTGVTLSKLSGTVTTTADSVAAGAAVSFTMTNTLIGANDTISLNHKSGGTFGAYAAQGRCATGSATIHIRNISAGALAEALTLQFNIIKGAMA